MKVVEAAALRRNHVLPVPFEVVPGLIPRDSARDPIAVRRNLQGALRAVVVVPTQVSNEFFLPAISPEAKLVSLRGVDAEFRTAAGCDPFGPGVTEQTDGKKAKLVGAVRRNGHTDTFGAVARLGEGDVICPGSQVRVNRSGGARARFDRAIRGLKIE